MSLREQAEEEDCEPCRFAVRIGMMVTVCKELKQNGHDIECKDLDEAVKSEQITVAEFTEKVKERIKATGDSEGMSIYKELKELMFKKVGEGNGRELSETD